jgi:pyruvate dehydrogenase E2 component (dihydrolipoamide acetyltransferase)
MPTPFIMPKVDMDQEKATIISWSKVEGESVKQDETVLVVETEKVAIDIPAPASGILAGIKFKAGDVVPVATVIAYILTRGESYADLPGKAAAAEKVSAHPGHMAVPAPPNEIKSPAEPLPAAAVVSPVALRVARDLGIDLNKVPSTNGRITRADVENHAASLKAPGQLAASEISSERIAATPAARRLARETGIDLAGLAGSGPNGRIQAEDVKVIPPPAVSAVMPKPVGDAVRPAEIIPLTGMRLKIAEKLQASFQDSPHISLTVEADVTHLEEVRGRMNALAARQGAGKISLTVLLVKVIAWALERNPYLNSSLLDQSIRLWQDVNVGVATALDNGLIVPVIHNTNKLSIRQIADCLADLTQRAKQGKLSVSDVQRGTFTLSNLGMYGIRQFRAVINPPESAILAAGAVVRKPVVVDERDTVEVRPILSLTLAADHRVVDGVVAARFLVDLVQGVENPDILLY